MNLYALFNSSLYHGTSSRKGFFEGWYFKFVDRKKEKSFAVIPGVSLNSSREDAHAFVQFLSGGKNESGNFNYPLKEFHSDKKHFSVEISKNYFSAGAVILEMCNENHRIAGNIRILEPYLWPRKFYSPGIMGPFSFVPFMECYHGVVSMDHKLEGEVRIDDELIDLSGGRGYIEKDWGRSFPKAWVWMQSNSFDLERTSFMLSIATIPWLGRSFTGCLCAFLFKEKLYKFTTYRGAKIDRVEVLDNEVFLQLRQAGFSLNVSAKKTSGARLISPVEGSMSGKIDESLTSEITVRLLRNDAVLFEGTGTNSGLEVVGELKLKEKSK